MSKRGIIYSCIGVAVAIEFIGLIVMDKNGTLGDVMTYEEESVDLLQPRIDRINELYAEEPTFDRVEKLDSNTIGIYFNSTPDIGVEDSIDSITRGQAVNLSKEVGGIASVKTFVGNQGQMFCTSVNGNTTNCNDYR